MCPRNDHAAAWKHVGRIARIARGGVDAVVVLDVDIRDPQPAQVAEDAIASAHVGILKGAWTPPVIYQHPLAYLLGLEGVALLRAFSGAYDRKAS
jgi:hypothetical protein